MRPVSWHEGLALSLAGVAFSFAGSVSLEACVATEEHGDDDLADVEASEDLLASNTVTDYAAIAPPQARVATRSIDARIGPPIAAGRRLAVIRGLVLQSTPARLVVDVDTYETSVLDADALDAGSRAGEAADAIEASPYLRSLSDLASSGRALSTLAAPSGDASEPFALTIDMCQSHKPWEKRLFDWAIGLSDRLHRPIPIGIAMTGLWAQAYPDELEQLLAWQAGGKLSITWINHSSTHPLHCQNTSCSQAQFLTAPSVDFDEEVFGLERSLIARGIVPSVVFRFPGLVHDRRRMDQLARLSLMAIDADAWIAKGEGIKPNAVVLVHGNGNEPAGITGFLDAVRMPSRSADLTSGRSVIVSPLRIAPVPSR